MKYIDADKLIEKFEKMIDNIPASVDSGAGYVIDEVYKIIDSLQQEQPEVDLDALVNEAFDKYSSVDGYGQLSVSFNRAELYLFIKKIARKEK